MPAKRPCQRQAKKTTSKTEIPISKKVLEKLTFKKRIGSLLLRSRFTRFSKQKVKNTITGITHTNITGKP